MIETVRFTNFKALKSNPINLGKITILAGLNSAGKSSVIQGILLVKSMVDNFNSDNLKIGLIKNFPLNGNYLLSLGSTLETISKDTSKEFLISIVDNQKAYDNKFITEESLTDTVYNINVEFNPEITSSSIASEDFYYLNAERLGPRIRHWINEKQNSKMHCGYRGEFTVEVLARTKGNTDEFPVSESKWLNNKKLPGFQDIISYTAEWMKFITPGTDFGDASIIGKIRSATLELNGNTPPNVGFGISYVMPIVVSGLLAKPGSILVIENPEAHLHPKGQSNIGFFLGQIAASGVQVIIETHSEHVVNGIRKSALTFSSLKPNDVKISFFKGVNIDFKAEVAPISMIENGNLDDFPVDFFDQTRQDLLEILKLTGR